MPHQKGPNSNFSPSMSGTNESVRLDNTWEQQLRNNARLDPRNEKLVMAHLSELINDQTKMRGLINDIFATLENRSNDFSAKNFKDFYDLTAKGMNAQILDQNYIMNEFNSLNQSKPGYISRDELQRYVTRLYRSIVNALSKNV